MLVINQRNYYSQHTMSRQACINCSSIPPNILILQCTHGLCIACAASICSVISQNIICPQCDHATYLSPQIISQLQSRYAQSSLNSSRNSNKTTHYKKNDISFQNSYKLPNSNLIKQHTEKQPYLNMSKNNSNRINNNINSIQQFDKQKLKKNKKKQNNESALQTSCSQHNEYQIMYICLECNNILICPQCIIHGIHKNHQVETLKKTLNKIQAQLSSKVYALDCSIEGLILASNQEKAKLRNKFQQINQLKNFAIQKYNRIKQQIDREQQQILDYCKNLMDNYQRDFLSIQNWIKKDLQTIQDEKNLIHRVLNPFSNNQPHPSTKNKKCVQVCIISEYFSNYLKSNDNNEVKDKNKHLWSYKENTKVQLIHAHQQQSIDQLTDRVQRIFVPPHCTALNQLPNICNIETKSPSLAASRCSQNKKTNLWGKQSLQSTSPINRLSRYKNKENNMKRIQNIARLL